MAVLSSRLAALVMGLVLFVTALSSLVAQPTVGPGQWVAAGLLVNVFGVLAGTALFVCARVSELAAHVTLRRVGTVQITLIALAFLVDADLMYGILHAGVAVTILAAGFVLPVRRTRDLLDTY
ncbi:MAG: hypothetical protein KDJ27_10200 [Gammaproteobacteria bacterium]|nr:hypothetical protein [Gammaproteobacteria bacterium]